MSCVYVLCLVVLLVIRGSVQHSMCPLGLVVREPVEVEHSLNTGGSVGLELELAILSC